MDDGCYRLPEEPVREPDPVWFAHKRNEELAWMRDDLLHPDHFPKCYADRHLLKQNVVDLQMDLLPQNATDKMIAEARPLESYRAGFFCRAL